MLTVRIILLMMCTCLIHALFTTIPPSAPNNATLCQDPADEKLAAILIDYTESYNESWNHTSPDDNFTTADFPELTANDAVVCDSLPNMTEPKFIRRSTCPGIPKVYLSDGMYPRETVVVVCCGEETARCNRNSHCELVNVREPRLWSTGEVQGNNTCVWRGFQYYRSVACACALRRPKQD